MKLLTLLKTIFLLGVVAMVAGDACILISFFAGSILPAPLVIALISFGVVGVLTGICWYVKKEKHQAESAQK